MVVCRLNGFICPRATPHEKTHAMVYDHGTVFEALHSSRAYAPLSLQGVARPRFLEASFSTSYRYFTREEERERERKEERKKEGVHVLYPWIEVCAYRGAVHVCRVVHVQRIYACAARTV